MKTVLLKSVSISLSLCLSLCLSLSIYIYIYIYIYSNLPSTKWFEGFSFLHTHLWLCCLSCRPLGGSMCQKRQHHSAPVLEMMHCYIGTGIHCTEQVVLTALSHVCYWLIRTYYLGDGWNVALQLPSPALNVSVPFIARFKCLCFRSVLWKKTTYLPNNDNSFPMHAKHRIPINNLKCGASSVVKARETVVISQHGCFKRDQPDHPSPLGVKELPSDRPIIGSGLLISSHRQCCIAAHELWQYRGELRPLPAQRRMRTR